MVRLGLDALALDALSLDAIALDAACTAERFAIARSNI
jgi:hypothetical protein